jgi:hypothetical protein
MDEHGNDHQTHPGDLRRGAARCTSITYPSNRNGAERYTVDGEVEGAIHRGK